MAHISAPDFPIKAITWSLTRPGNVNVSAYTGARRVAANPWHGKWSAHVELATRQGDAFGETRSFLSRCKGSLNTFRLYATAGAQNSDSGVSVAVDVAAGASSLTLAGFDTYLDEGQFLTVNGQLVCLTAPQSLTSVTFEPPLREAASAGTYVETARPFAIVYLSGPQSQWGIAPYRLHDSAFDVEEAVAEPLTLFFDTFTEPSGTQIDRRDAQYRLVGGYEYGDIPGRWRKLSGGWETDGNGYAHPTSVPGDTNNMLGACLLAPAGTAGDRKITVVLNSSTNDRPRLVACTDGRYFVIFEYTNTGSGVRIREGDMQAAQPTYSSTANSWTLLSSGTLSSYVAADDQTFTLELSGSTLTVTHVNSGTVVTATISVPIGPYFGISAGATAVKFKSVKVEPVSRPTFFSIGNGIGLVDARVIEFLGDADGLSMDTANPPNLVVGNSSNQNATIGGMYSFEQARREVFKKLAKDVNSSISVSDRYTGTEGVCFWTDPRYVFINDTPATGQFLLDLQTGNRLQLSTYANGQDCRLLTINGETCFVATSEGGSGGVGIGDGGIVGYRLIGSDPMLLASWQQFTIVQRPGAWAFQKTRFGFLDLDGDGIADELYFGARDNANTDVTAPGYYSVKKPASPFTTAWTETARFVASDGNDCINFDVGDFSGDGNDLDIIYAIKNQTGAPKYLRKSTGYTSTATVTLGLTTTHQLYNVMRMPVRGTGTRDSFLAWVAYRGFMHVYWDGAAWQSKVIRGENIDHGWNACNGPIWDRGDGTFTAFIGNSFGNALLDMRFRNAA